MKNADHERKSLSNHKDMCDDYGITMCVKSIRKAGGPPARSAR